MSSSRWTSADTEMGDDFWTIPTVRSSEPLASRDPNGASGGGGTRSHERPRREGHSFALLLGFVMRARSAFFASLRSVAATLAARIDDEAGLDDGGSSNHHQHHRHGGYHHLGAPGIPQAGLGSGVGAGGGSGGAGGGGGGGGSGGSGGGGGTGGSAAAVKAEDFYSLVEYVQLRESFARDHAHASLARARMRHRAAVRIQRAWHRHVLMRDSRMMALEASKAATKIQAAFRGHLVRAARLAAVRLEGLRRKYAAQRVASWLLGLRVWLRRARDRTLRREKTALWRTSHAEIARRSTRQLLALQESAGSNPLVAATLVKWRARYVANICFLNYFIFILFRNTIPNPRSK
jgi:hypothetical protein